ncbi:protein mistic [Bacillus glycinifermentans]|uniref:Protein mistic n=1 Tax=Bacillus glycinifermentans TaxID=1664069 RepID=A0A0J6E7V9_9BACI|nr:MULTISPECIES: protein mistic [Bacillus]ATH92938.1 protein mistic [Bacillus glycinifermentans]KKB74632.1 protein mistic [Bacillus sp. TH008]KMM53682.1 protein mistic [Bacillus glycinifermentans]KRT94154.1 protein mistic [Bacillus glycinifermentans]MBU8788570.1 protein mistic [Bacillus glycinifermentans]
MKVTDQEKEQLSTAIDKMNEGLDAFILLYNESVKDEPLIDYEDETADVIKQAIEQYGKESINQKLNAIIKEILSFSLLKDGEKS